MRQRLFPGTMIALGCGGMLLCVSLYVQYCAAWQDALGRLDTIAGDAHVQAELGSELLDDWGSVLVGIDEMLGTHQQSMRSLANSTEQATESVREWRGGLRGFSSLALNTRDVCDKLASRLPIEVPSFVVGTQDIEFEIPTFETRSQTVKLPYPTATVGSRKVEVDLGVTDFKFDVPTLRVGSKERVVTVPDSPTVKLESRRVTVPSNVEVTYRKFLTEEKELLQATSRELERNSELLIGTDRTLSEIESLLESEFAASMEATLQNLARSQRSVRTSYQKQIPEFQQRLVNEGRQLEQSRSHFRTLRGMVPWVFVLLGLIPTGLVLQGLAMWFAKPPLAAIRS